MLNLCLLLLVCTRIFPEHNFWLCTLDAVTQIEEWDIYDTKMALYSDSQSAVNALKRHWDTSKREREVKGKLVKLKAERGVQIDIKWIKGHADNTGNELADYLAKQGSKMGEEEVVTVNPIVLPTRKEIKQKIEDKYFKIWAERWPDAYTGYGKNKYHMRHSKKMIKVPFRMTKKLLNRPRHELRLLVEMITNHCRLKHHLSKWTVYNKWCRFCDNYKEKAFHILNQCEAKQTARDGWDALQVLKGKKVWATKEYDQLLDKVKYMDIAGMYLDPG